MYQVLGEQSPGLQEVDSNQFYHVESLAVPPLPFLLNQIIITDFLELLDFFQ